LPAVRRLLAITLIAIAAALAACGGKEKTADFGGGATQPDTASQAPTQAATPLPPGCEKVEKPAPKPSGGQKKPTAALDASKKHTLTFETSCGKFTITLNLKTAPKTSASLVALAKAGFFDDTIFYRIVPGFVVQGGDPTGQGDGDPGYATVDKPPSNAKYTRGVVAMAKSDSEKPGTAGSQFYVVTAPDAGLPPTYALLGKVTKGLAVVDRIGKLGDPASGDEGVPLATVVIRNVKVGGS
jgi:peptidyl-prolyl cis-trans isomerase B (cyclophilin B)